MKKLLFVFLVLVALVVAAFVVVKKVSVGESKAAALVPDDTALFVQVPDALRTAVRSRKTALAQIANEPAVQAFFKNPKELLPNWGALQKQLEQLAACAPREVFLAVTASAQTEPKVIAGFSFSGRKASADELLRSLRKESQRLSPAGRSELIKYGDAEIETFTYEKSVFASTVKGKWCFAGNDLTLLKATLDRLDGRRAGKVLREQAAFASSLKRMPRDGELMVFLQPRAFLARIEPMLKANGQGSEAQLAELKKIEAVTFATKMEGAQMHDTMFVLHAGASKGEPLAQGALALSSTDTLLFYDGRFQMPAALDPAQNPTLAPVAALGGDWFAWMQNIVKALGGSGGELGVQIDLAGGTLQPGFLLTVETRDVATAERLAAAVAGSPADAGSWERGSAEGAPTFTLKMPLIAAVATPVMTVNGKFVLLALNPESLKSAIDRRKVGSPNLAKTERFRGAEKRVVKPSEAFGYVDARALFEQIYATAQFPLMVWMMASPEAGKVVDAKKLPPVEVIAKHLGPMVYSQAAVENGTLAESVGPVTFLQVLVGIVGGGAAMYGTMQTTELSLPPVAPSISKPAPPPPVAPGS